MSEMPAYPATVLAGIRFAEVEGRLPAPTGEQLGMIFPFEADALRTVRFYEPVLPEPARHGEDPAKCSSCTRPDSDFVWTNDNWRLDVLTVRQKLGVHTFMLTPRVHADLDGLDSDLAAEQGQLLVLIDRAITAGIDGVGRVHLIRWGDGGVHMHWWLIARPAGLLQLRGSSLGTWLDVLPPLPAAMVEADVARVVSYLP
jgi:hypothetical protein